MIEALQMNFALQGTIICAALKCSEPLKRTIKLSSLTGVVRSLQGAERGVRQGRPLS